MRVRAPHQCHGNCMLTSLQACCPSWSRRHRSSCASCGATCAVQRRTRCRECRAYRSSCWTPSVTSWQSATPQTHACKACWPGPASATQAQRCPRRRRCRCPRLRRCQSRHWCWVATANGTARRGGRLGGTTARMARPSESAAGLVSLGGVGDTAAATVVTVTGVAAGGASGGEAVTPTTLGSGSTSGSTSIAAASIAAGAGARAAVRMSAAVRRTCLTCCRQSSHRQRSRRRPHCLWRCGSRSLPPMGRSREGGLGRQGRNIIPACET